VDGGELLGDATQRQQRQGGHDAPLLSVPD
jgi:hypothetical protein